MWHLGQSHKSNIKKIKPDINEYILYNFTEVQKISKTKLVFSNACRDDKIINIIRKLLILQGSNHSNG